MDHDDDSTDYLPALIRGLSEALEQGRLLALAGSPAEPPAEENTLAIVDHGEHGWYQSVA